MSLNLKLAIWIVLGCSSAISVSAQTTAVKNVKSTWADIDRWPDFTTGSWGVGFGGLAPPPPASAPSAVPSAATSNAPPIPMPNNEILSAPLTPSYKARVAAILKLSGPGGSGAASCEPEGVVTDMGSNFYFGKDVIIVGGATDRANIWRRIYLRQTEHGDPEPTYFGHSIAHWEDKTLVIDTVAIRPEAQLITGVPLNSTRTHIVERIRLLDPNLLEWKKTIENADVFTTPWVITKKIKRTTGEEFPEAFCWRDREEHSGTQGPDMTR